MEAVNDEILCLINQNQLQNGCVNMYNIVFTWNKKYKIYKYHSVNALVLDKKMPISEKLNRVSTTENCNSSKWRKIVQVENNFELSFFSRKIATNPKKKNISQYKIRILFGIKKLLFHQFKKNRYIFLPKKN